MGSWFLLVFVALVLITAAITDLSRQYVYDWLTVPAMLVGLGYHAWQLHWPGFGHAVLGLAVGGLIFLPAWFSGGLGAGDIKLMAALGACLGWVFAINTAIDAALIGGIIAVIVLAAHGELGTTCRRLWRWLLSRLLPGRSRETLPKSHPLPFAAVIALGAAAAFWLPPWLSWP